MQFAGFVLRLFTLYVVGVGAVGLGRSNRLINVEFLLSFCVFHFLCAGTT